MCSVSISTLDPHILYFTDMKRATVSEVVLFDKIRLPCIYIYTNRHGEGVFSALKRSLELERSKFSVKA